MTTTTTSSLPLEPGSTAPARPERLPSARQVRARLRLQDRMSARRAELDLVASMLAEAAELVRAGWLQGSWFGYREPSGTTRSVSSAAEVVPGRPVDAVCLVGAVVQAGGGLAAVRTQPVQRALDLTWHTLVHLPGDPVRWAPPPHVRLAHVRELTAWNDHPGRGAAQVQGLLECAARAASAERLAL